MDPLSITARLLQQLFAVSRTIVRYVDQVRNPDKRVTVGCLGIEIDTLSMHLKAFDNTLKDHKSSYSRSLSEGDAKYLECVHVSIRYCQQTIQSLEEAIKRSLKGEEIAMYTQQIESYRQTIELAMQWMSLYFPLCCPWGGAMDLWLIEQVIGAENTTCNDGECHQVGHIVANNRRNTR